MTTDPNHDLLFLLHDVARLIRTEADRRARTYGMTRAQWAMLVRLDGAPGLSQKELAALLEVEPITVARLVDRLAASGMLERRADPADRRVWRLHLLPPARAMLHDIDTHREELLQLVTSGMTAGALAAAREALLQMKTNLCADRPGRRDGKPAELAATDDRKVA